MHYEMITVGMKNAFMYVVRQQKHSFLTSPWALGKEGPFFAILMVHPVPSNYLA
jgi:hypothetical protein